VIAAMKHTLLLLLSLALAVPAAAPAEVQPKPNVLLIVSDDQGYGDFGFTGNRLVRTPALDRLASRAAVFKNFAAAPACSPTRAALWTGRDHLLTGVWGVGARAGLRRDEARMPAFFKAAGYRTFHAGKLDSVKVGKDGPPAFGWDEWMGGGGYEHRDPMIFSSSGSGRATGWFAELMTDRTLAFIRGNRDQPWFASVAFIVPHMPWVCGDSFSAPFLAQGCSASLAACYGSIAQMDACIGRLLDALRESAQDERTVIVFLSDNGQTGPEAQQAGEDGAVRGDDWAKRNVAGLRGHKATVWENGIRVPCLVRWPGRFQPGDRAAFACVEDLLPTVLELSGVSDAQVPHLPFTGTSLTPALRDPSAALERPEALRLTIAGPGAPRLASGAAAPSFADVHLALRGARFVYHALPKEPGALYDLAADPGETRDVREEHPDVAARMADECRKRWDAVLATGRAFAVPERNAARPSDPKDDSP
jgi:arylsulfatase A